MALADLFSHLGAVLFGGQGAAPADDIDPALLDEAVEAIVEAVEPRIRMVPRYAEKLAPCTRATIRHMRALAPRLPEVIELSRAAWGSDPRVNAYFAAADDIPALLARSRELRAFFDDPANALCGEAYALLGMRMEERSVLAPALEGGILRQDVAQTTVSFSGHRLFAPAAELAATRRAVGMGLLRRMAETALERIVAMRERATELEERKGIVAARLRMLKLRSGGLQELAGGEDPSAEIARLEAALKAAADEHLEIKSSLATLDHSIARIDEVLGHPEEHLGINRIALRINRMGYKLPAGSSEPASELTLHELWLGGNLRGILALVRIPRSELPPEQDLLADAERYL